MATLRDLHLLTTGVGLTVLLLGFLVVRLPPEQFGSWSMVLVLVFFFNSVVNFVVGLDLIQATQTDLLKSGVRT